jgi:hypothetical protein
LRRAAKVTAGWLAGIQILTLSTIVAYATNNLALFAIAWGASLIPFLGSRFFNRPGVVTIPREHS